MVETRFLNSIIEPSSLRGSPILRRAGIQIPRIRVGGERPNTRIQVPNK